MENLISMIFFILVSCLMITLSHADMFCNKQDEDILLQVKSHFSGVGQLSDWDPTTDCDTWSNLGVYSEDSPNSGRVFAITISRGTGLSGQIPDVIGNLPFLQEIMFENEPNLTGPIPQSFSNLKNLEIIYLAANGLTGQIPDFLARLKHLQQIDISSNQFTGSIPASLASLPALASLNVSGNQLCGAIPTGLKKFGATSFQHNKCLCGAPLHAC